MNKLNTLIAIAAIAASVGEVHTRRPEPPHRQKQRAAQEKAAAKKKRVREEIRARRSAMKGATQQQLLTDRVSTLVEKLGGIDYLESKGRPA
jgi:hypothetical protein